MHVKVDKRFRFTLAAIALFLALQAPETHTARAIPESPHSELIKALPSVEFHFVPSKKQELPLKAYVSTPALGPTHRARVHKDRIHLRTDKSFSITVLWHVHKYGHLWLSTDSGESFYDPKVLEAPLFLNLELAKARVKRNQRVLKKYLKKGLKLSTRVMSFKTRAEELLKEASIESNLAKKARLADMSLAHAIDFGERLELAWAQKLVEREDFEIPLFGVDSRHYFWSNVDNLNKYFPKLFDYATITHYLVDSWFPPFEPHEGDLRWGAREDIYQWLKGHNATVQARPVLWFHKSVTPDWLKEKNFSELKQYAVKHATALVRHWGDRITHWEVANEMHDWANIHNLSPQQITEIIRVTAKAIRRLQPEATLIVNSTSIFGNYAALETGPGEKPTRRTPLLFIKDLMEAKVDFDVIGLQLYHPRRDLSDLVRLIEDFEKFEKEIMISEMGVPSYYEHDEFLISGETRWSETAQAEWAEKVFRVLGPRPSIRVLCWYDLTDIRSFVDGGGVLTDDGLPKEVFAHLKLLKEEWQEKLSKRKSSRAGFESAVSTKAQ